MSPFAIGAAVILLIMAGLAAAADNQPARPVLPTINIEKAGQCVEPTAEMRRDHMKMILHQRDQTVHRGIRTTKHSLKNCIDCHASAKTNSVLGKDGFCESCHAYAAVRLDCFECHSPSPREAASADKPVARTAGVTPEPARRGAIVAPVATRRVDGRTP
jgi:hypothetical protein